VAIGSDDLSVTLKGGTRGPNFSDGPPCICSTVWLRTTKFGMVICGEGHLPKWSAKPLITESGHQRRLTFLGLPTWAHTVWETANNFASEIIIVVVVGLGYSTWVRWVVSTNIMQFNEFEYHFACRRSPLFYHESWQNDICSFRAMTVAFSVSFKLISF